MSIGRSSAEQEYQRTCEYAQWELLARLLAGTTHETFERNVILKCKNGERRTLAAELILLGKIDLLTSLCASPHFTLNRSSVEAAPIVTALHAAAKTQNKTFIDKCLAALSSDTSIADKAAYVNMAVSFADLVSVTPFALSFMASTDDNDVSDKLLAAGANPYCLTHEKTGSQHSLFYYARFMREKFQYYRAIAKRDPEKLKEFLTQAFDFRCVDGATVSINIMEESLLVIVEAEQQESPVKEHEEEDAGLRSLISLTIAEQDEKVSSIRLIQDLYREYCLERPNTTEVLSVSQLRKHYRAMAANAANEARAYEKVFEPWQNALMSVSLSKGQIPYLSSIDDGDTDMMCNAIGFATKQSPYYMVAEHCIALLPSYPLKVRYQPTMRRVMQVFYGPLKGHTPITYAVLCKKKAFIDACINANHVELNAPVVFGPYAGMTPLGLALLAGHHDIAVSLLHYFMKIKAEPVSFFDKPQAGVMFNISLVELVNAYGDAACKKLLIELHNLEDALKLATSCTTALRQYSRLIEKLNSNIDRMQLLVDRGKKIKACEACDELYFDRTYNEMSEEEKGVLEYLLAFPVPPKMPEIQMDADGPSAAFLRHVTNAIKEAKDFESSLDIHTNDASRRYNNLIDAMDESQKEKKQLRAFTSAVQSVEVVKPVSRRPGHRTRLRSSAPEDIEVATISLVEQVAITPGKILSETNYAVEVYNSYLDAVRQNAKMKLDDLQFDNIYYAEILAAHAELRRLLDHMRGIVKLAQLPETATDEEIKSKKSDCEVAGKHLKALEVNFNAHFKVLERALRPLNKSREMARSFDELYDDDDNYLASTSSTSTSSSISASLSDASDVSPNSDSASSSPAKPKSPLPYDIQSDDYTVYIREDGLEATARRPHKPSGRSHHKQRARRQQVLSLGEVQAMFSRTPSPLAVDSLLPTDLFKSCADKIGHLKRLHQDYQTYCKVNSLTGLADLECAKFISAIEGELLALYETLLVIQRLHPRYGIFATYKVAEDLRNMMKYGHVFIFSHETNYLKQLIDITFDLTANAVSNRIRHASISIITREQVPCVLYVLLDNKKPVEDINTLKARRNNMSAILRSLTQQIAKVSENDDSFVKQGDSARAQVFCLAVLGQISKEIAQKTSILGLGKYSHRLTTRVLSHVIGDEFAQDLKMAKTTPLLNHFSAAARSAEGHLYVASLIALMTKNDVTKLLNEILDAKSHQIEGAWVALINPYLIRVIHKIALRYIEVTEAQGLLNLPANLRADEIDFLLSSLEMWAICPELKDSAVKHPFYIALEESLSHLLKGRKDQAYDSAKGLFVNLGAKSRFDLFAAHYLKSEEERQTLKAIQHILGELVLAMQMNTNPQQFARRC